MWWWSAWVGFESADCLLTLSKLKAQFLHLEKGDRSGTPLPEWFSTAPETSAVPSGCLLFLYVRGTLGLPACWRWTELNGAMHRASLDKPSSGHRTNDKVRVGYTAEGCPRTTGRGSRRVLVQGPTLSRPQWLLLSSEGFHLMDSSQPFLESAEPVRCSVGKESHRQINLGNSEHCLSLLRITVTLCWIKETCLIWLNSEFPEIICLLILSPFEFVGYTSISCEPKVSHT